MMSENGAKIVIVPMDNLAELANIPASVLGVVIPKPRNL
jgi:ATP-dependent Lon protease